MIAQVLSAVGLLFHNPTEMLDLKSFRSQYENNIDQTYADRLEHLHDMLCFATAYTKHFAIPLSHEQHIHDTFDRLLAVLPRMHELPNEPKVWESREAERAMNDALTDSMSGIVEVIYGVYRMVRGDVLGGGLLVADGLRHILSSIGEFEEATHKENKALEATS